MDRETKRKILDTIEGAIQLANEAKLLVEEDAPPKPSGVIARPGMVIQKGDKARPWGVFVVSTRLAFERSWDYPNDNPHCEGRMYFTDMKDGKTYWGWVTECQTRDGAPIIGYEDD